MEGRRSAQDGGAHLEPVADAVEAVAAREQLFERTQPPVREEGRDASSQYGRRDETRPVSTGGRGGRGGAGDAGGEGLCAPRGAGAGPPLSGERCVATVDL